MLILLPPSETKRTGGEDGTKLDYTQLRFPELTRLRRQTVGAVRSLARDPDATITALRLGATQHGEVAHNRALTTSPTMPAIDRYTGVLYDALDAGSLAEPARRFLGTHVAIHSAVLGLIGALDPIPAYRLSHDSRLPGMRLKAQWSTPIASVLAAQQGPILDARSEAYAALGPAPADGRTVFLRVMTIGRDGHTRALGHFNKHAKGELVRALALAGGACTSIDDVIATAGRSGLHLERGGQGGPGGVAELVLVV